MKRLVVVIVILLALLSGLKQLIYRAKSTRRPAADIARLERISMALHEFMAASNSYPSRLELLSQFEPAKQILLSPDNPFIDTYGRPFVYESSGTNFVLLCLGSDGIRGTDDDLSKQW